MWRRHELTVVAAIRRRITVLSHRCTAGGVGVQRVVPPAALAYSAVVPSRQQALGRLCTGRPKGHGPAWTHPSCAAAAKAEEEEAAAVVRSDDVTTAARCSDFTAVSKLPLVHCVVTTSKYDTGSAAGCKRQPS